MICISQVKGFKARVESGPYINKEMNSQGVGSQQTKQTSDPDIQIGKIENTILALGQVFRGYRPLDSKVSQFSEKHIILHNFVICTPSWKLVNDTISAPRDKANEHEKVLRFPLPARSTVHQLHLISESTSHQILSSNTLKCK